MTGLSDRKQAALSRSVSADRPPPLFPQALRPRHHAASQSPHQGRARGRDERPYPGASGTHGDLSEGRSVGFGGVTASSLDCGVPTGLSGAMARHPMTKFIHLAARAGVYAAVLIGFAPHAFAACASPAEFGRWLQGFKKEAVAQGISPERRSHTRSTASAMIPRPSPRTAGRACSRRASCNSPAAWCRGNRLQVGGSLLKKYGDTFAASSSNMACPAPCWSAFWGLETDFGKVMGNMETMRSLAT